MLNLLFPRTCIGCNSVISSTEALLCLSCRHQIPLTRFHQNENSLLMNKFFGRFPVEHATALFYFQKRGLTQRLMHRLKYKGVKEISDFLGKWLGEELKEISGFSDIQMVVPVPLHKQKLKKRGYNQVEGFGRELAQVFQVPYRDDILIKITKTGSQVFKTRMLRFESEEVFAVQKLNEIKNLHVLLVDDIITTGATLEKCALQLLKGEGVKISIAVMATT